MQTNTRRSSRGRRAEAEAAGEREAGEGRTARRTPVGRTDGRPQPPRRRLPPLSPKESNSLSRGDIGEGLLLSGRQTGVDGPNQMAADDLR